MLTIIAIVCQVLGFAICLIDRDVFSCWALLCFLFCTFTIDGLIGTIKKKNIEINLQKYVIKRLTN